MRKSSLLIVLVASMLTVVAPADETASEAAWIGVRLSRAADGNGVAVSRIFEDSPAARAGLRASDVIVEFDGTPVAGMSDLIKNIRAHGPGDWVPLTVDRTGHEFNLRVRLGVRPANPRGLKARNGWIGVKSIEIPSSLREHFGAPADAGVMISEIMEGSPAESAGFELGDVVYDVGGTPVKSGRALRELVGRGGVKNDLEFTLMRWGAEIVLEARLETKPEEPASP